MASFRRLPSGKWQATVLLRNGKRTTFSHPKRETTVRWARQVENKRDAGELIPERSSTRVTVAAWYERWFDTRTLEKHTLETYASVWRNHIEPHLGDKVIGAVSRMDVEAWMARLNRDEVGARTRQLALVVLSSMMKSAMDEGLRADNPCARVAAPKHQAAEPVALSPAQLHKLLAAVPEGQDRASVAMMGLCGLRWSEMAAVKGDAVDWLRGQLLVRRAVAKNTGKVKEIGKTKKSRRVVPIPAELLEDLSRLMEGRELDDLLFQNPRGGLWDYSEWRRKVWLPAVAAAKLKGVTSHDLRHSYASWMAGAGVDQFRIQNLLGHSDPHMTQRYMHLRPDHFDVVSDVLRAVTAHHDRTDDSPQIESGNGDTA